MSDYLQSILEPCAKAGHEAQRALSTWREAKSPEPEGRRADARGAGGGAFPRPRACCAGRARRPTTKCGRTSSARPGESTPRYRDLPEWVHRRDMAFKQAVATASAAATALLKPKKTSAKSAKELDPCPEVTEASDLARAPHQSSGKATPNPRCRRTPTS